jgi:hypothetical protein
VVHWHETLREPPTCQPDQCPKVDSGVLEMNEIKWYKWTDGEDSDLPSADGLWAHRADVEKLLKQFPEGMEHCTFEVLECDVGHSRLHATNWIDHGCRVCAEKKLQKELQEMTAKAVAAFWLIPEDCNIAEVQTLAKRAREAFSGEDQRTIAKLRDRIANLEQALQNVRRPPLPGVSSVYGVKGDHDSVFALPILRIQPASNGGVEIVVRLP